MEREANAINMKISKDLNNNRRRGTDKQGISHIETERDR